jgi:Rne/Rng family ribonuclease
MPASEEIEVLDEQRQNYVEAAGMEPVEALEGGIEEQFEESASAVEPGDQVEGSETAELPGAVATSTDGTGGAAVLARQDGRDRDRGGRDRGGRRGRRRGRGGRRGFPDSKYAPAEGNEEPEAGGVEDGDAEAGAEVASPVAHHQAEEPVEVFVLPGESIRKYRGAPSPVQPPPLPQSAMVQPTSAVVDDEPEEVAAPAVSVSEVANAAQVVPELLAEPAASELTLADEDSVEHPSANALPDAPLHPERVEFLSEKEIIQVLEESDPIDTDEHISSVQAIAERMEERADEADEASEVICEVDVEETSDDDDTLSLSAIDPDSEDDSVEDTSDEDPEIRAMIFGEVNGEEEEVDAVEDESAGADGVNIEDVQEEAERVAATLPVNVQTRDRNQRFARQDNNRRQRGRRGRGRDRGGDRPPQQQGQGGVAPAEVGQEQQVPAAVPVPAPQAESRPQRQDRPQVSHGQMPSISDLLKEGQEIIVQIAKEPLGQKGARITSHIALPGRYVVFMPTLDHMGVSRKIASDEERHRLKRILQGVRGTVQGGCIIRTAGEGKPDEEIVADIQFLHNLWQDIKQKAEKRPAPLLLHHDLDIVQRVLRDQFNDSYKSIWVDNEEMYESILRFVQRFQPALLSKVKLYTRNTPIFDAFNITNELEKALRPKVWLKSGGYIVINQTEALVAIDINTGKFVGKSNRLEDTIVKTNLEAVKEIVRQVRLRDLGGIIVIDFIDMDERKNRQKVMQALEDAMRQDRAPYKILQFNDFGLVAVTRKRVKQSLERTMCSPCPYCEGAGYVKSVASVVSEILQEAQKLAQVIDHSDVVLRCSPEVAKLFKSHHNEYLEELEEILKRPVMVKSDPTIHQEKFDLA